MLNGVHLYPQPFQHETAFVVGTREGLQELRNLIDRALEADIANGEVTTADGEGYDLVVISLLQAAFDEAQLPYTDEEWPGSPWSLVDLVLEPDGQRCYRLKTPQAQDPSL